MKLFVKRIGHSLHPSFEQSEFDKIKQGQEYEVKVSQPRNLKFHRKYFVLVSLLFDNQDKIKDKESFRKAFEMLSGNYTPVSMGGYLIKTHKSISFASMDEVEFNEHYNRCLNLAVDTFGHDKDELLKELMTFA